MSNDRYQEIRKALPILIAEAQAKGGRNERAALIVELLEERDALNAENERLRKDAERYRWLRKGVHDDIAVVRGLGAMDSVGGEANTYSKEIDGDDLDATIDAAMSKEGK